MNLPHMRTSFGVYWEVQLMKTLHILWHPEESKWKDTTSLGYAERSRLRTALRRAFSKRQKPKKRKNLKSISRIQAKLNDSLI